MNNPDLVIVRTNWFSYSVLDAGTSAVDGVGEGRGPAWGGSGVLGAEPVVDAALDGGAIDAEPRTHNR